MAVSYGTYTITEIEEGSQIWTSSAAPTTPDYTFNVSHLTGDSDIPIREGDIIMYSYYRYTVLSISSDGTTVLTGNRTSIRGATGAASVTYALIVSNLAIVKDKNGNLSPSTITVTAKSQTGSNAMANYTGRIKIETTTNNSTWTSRINEDAATKTYTIPSDTVAIRCSLYLKGGTTTLLDQQTVPVVSDGIDGTNITITSTSVTYQKGTSGTVKPTGTWETGVQSVGQGEYLWTRTIVNYSDGSSTEAYSVSRNAVNGTNGTNGKDGKDGTSPTVSSTVTEYAQSTNGTTPPTSGWDTTPKTATAGQYMWTRVTVTYSDSVTAVSYTVSKNGTNGTNGINTATVYLYKKGTAAPSVPSGNTTYTFSTKKLTGTLNSWSQTIPTTGDGQCYVIAAVASSNGTTDTIATSEWSTPIQFNGTNGINGTNGTNGTNGLNQATIFLYKRGTSVTKPTTSVTYTFSTGALSAEPNSWKRNIPTIDGNPCWVVSATAIGSGTTATITGSNWSAPVKLVEDGSDGDDAYSVVLTNENHTFAGNSTSALASEMECNVIAYKGTTQVAATIGTITGQPTGMTTSLLNNGTTNAAFSVNVTTSMVTKNGVLNIPITVDGKNFTKKFTYSLAFDGVSVTNVTSTNNTTDGGTSVVTITMSDGTKKTFNVKNGNKGSTGDTAEWFYGTALTHESGTATATITGAVVGSMYLNTETSLVYKCTNINGSTMTWTYAGDLTTGVINNIEIGGRNLLSKDNVLSHTTSYTEEKYIYTGLYGAGAGLKFPASIFEIGTRYVLSFKFKKISGTLTAIGGHCQGFSSFSKNFIIDGEKKENRTYIQGYLMNDDSDVHSVEVHLIFNGNASDNNLYIQPNRGAYTQSNDNKFQIWDLQLEKGDKATQWTPAPEDIQDGIDHAQNVANVALSQSVEYIIGTQTAVTGSWTGISNTISELKDGTQIRYWLPHAGSGNATLNLTLTNGTTTGAIPIYRQGGYVSNGNVVANRVTTHFPTGSVVSMTYGIDRSISVVSSRTTYTGLFTGWFADGAYDSGNTINRVRLQNAITAETAITAGRIICGTASGYKNIGANVSFDLSYPLLYADATITASKTGDNNYLSINGISATSNGTVQSGAAKKTLYLKGKVTGNTFKISASPFMTTVQPTTDDGYYYIPLGIMYSTTAIYFQSSNRLYAHIDGAFQPVDTAAVLRAEEAKKVATNYLSADSTGIMVADMQDGEQTPSTATGRNVFIDSDSVNIRDGQKTLASFRGEDTKFYDVNSDNKEVASFGSNGVCVGNKDEQHFIVDTESIQAINENGSPIFSVTSTGGTITTDVVVAKGGNSQGYTLEVILSGMKANENTQFYVDSLIQNVDVLWSTTPFDSFYVDGETASVVCLPHNDPDTGTPLDSRHRVELPSFLFTYGTPQHKYYHLRGTFVSNGGNTYKYTGTVHIEYDGQYKILMYAPYNDLDKTNGNVEEDVDIGWCGYIWSDIKSNLGYSKAPAMTFGTRSNRSTISPLSVTIGEELYANSRSQLSIGKYNVRNSNPLAFVVGNGTDDDNRSNAFSVDWDGNAEVAGDLKVIGDLDVANDINIGGNINLTGQIQNNGNPMIKVVRKKFTSIGINHGKAYSATRDISIDGYTPIGITGIKVTNNTAYDSSYHADASWCVVPAFYIDYGITSDDTFTDYLYYYIWNQNTSKNVVVDFNVRIVYISNNIYS